MSPPTLPPSLELERVLTPGRTFLVHERDGASARPLVLKRCTTAPALLRPRLKALPRSAASGVVAERELLQLAEGCFSLRPYVAGTPLRELPPGIPALPLLSAVAQALGALHAHGLAHGRLHAGNVIVDAQGRPHLVDCLDVGTPEPRPGADGRITLHAAPEQLRGKPASARGDVYALGLLLFERLTGRHPLRGEDWLELVRRGLYEDILLFPEEEHALPPGAAPLLQRSLARAPTRRFRGAAQLVPALSALTGGAPAPLAPPAPDAAAAPAALPPPTSPAPPGGSAAAPGPASSVAAQVHAFAPRVRGGLRWGRVAAEDLGAETLERWRSLRPALRLGVPALAGLVALGAVAGPGLGRGQRLEREVESLLAARQPQQARARLAAAQADGTDPVVLDKLQGDVACALGEDDTCLRLYQAVVERSDRYADDVRLRDNVLARFARADRQWRAAQVASRLTGVETVLAEHLTSEHYWKRWSAVRALEARGEEARIPYAVVYGLDVLHSGTCGTRRVALERLERAQDAAAALPALRQALARAEKKFFGDGCLGRDLERVVRALEAQASVRTGG